MPWNDWLLWAGVMALIIIMLIAVVDVPTQMVKWLIERFRKH